MPGPADQVNQRIIAEFRANHGRVGGHFAGAPMLLLHTVGARSGQPRINPVMYLADGDRYLVFASKAGSDRNPDWYWNLRASPDVTIEIVDETVTVHATELTGAERDEKYRIQSERYPGFAAYQQNTSRTIPVIALTRRADKPQGGVRPLRAGGRPPCRRCPASPVGDAQVLVRVAAAGTNPGEIAIGVTSFSAVSHDRT
jgi:deazaflavin-dependent oxidoreductase (nitroreductase family)